MSASKRLKATILEWMKISKESREKRKEVDEASRRLLESKQELATLEMELFREMSTCFGGQIGVAKDGDFGQLIQIEDKTYLVLIDPPDREKEFRTFVREVQIQR